MSCSQTLMPPSTAPPYLCEEGARCTDLFVPIAPAQDGSPVCRTRSARRRTTDSPLLGTPLGTPNSMSKLDATFKPIPRAGPPIPLDQLSPGGGDEEICEEVDEALTPTSPLFRSIGHEEATAERGEGSPSKTVVLPGPVIRQHRPDGSARWGDKDTALDWASEPMEPLSPRQKILADRAQREVGGRTALSLIHI